MQLYKIIKNRLSLVFLRLRYFNRPYHEFYKAVMRHRTKDDIQKAVGNKWDVIGPHQCNFLIKQGLKPENTLLDIGCGSLRGGIHFIKYLETGNYYGIDISPDIIEAGSKILEKEGLTNKEPHLKINTDILLDDFNGKKFDFLNAQSVLSHMPKEDVQELFSNLHKVMHKDSKFIATFFKDDLYRSSRQYTNFHYPLNMLLKMGNENGLSIKELLDADYERVQSILLITKK